MRRRRRRTPKGRKKPDAILTADMHLTERTPVCRTDDYVRTMARKVAFLVKLVPKRGCPILDGGDLFDHWKTPPSLLSWAIDNLPDGIITTPGNHDLPQHNPDLLYRSGLEVLRKAGKIRLAGLEEPVELEGGIRVFGAGWAPKQVFSKLLKKLEDIPKGKGIRRNVLLLHTMTWTESVGRPWSGSPDPEAREILEIFSDFDLIVTGHNHQSFWVREGGRLLVNPGSLMRRTADQISHHPTEYLWFAEENMVQPVKIPIRPAEEVMTREHLDRVKERDDRITTFIQRLNQNWEAEFSFQRNLEIFFETNKVSPKVEEIVWRNVSTEEN